MANTPRTSSDVDIDFGKMPEAGFVAPPGWSFHVAASHDGPYELRGLLINNMQFIVGPPHSSNGARVLTVPLPSSMTAPFRMLWWITAGHNIPKIAVAISFGAKPPVLVQEKAPLKKGESWTTKDPVVFPKP